MFPAFDDFSNQLQALAHDNALSAKHIDRYMAAHGGVFPVIEGNTAHFIAKAHPGVAIAISGDWNGFNPRWGLMQPLGGDLVHYQYTFEDDARLDYLLVELPATEVQDWLAGRDVYVRSGCDPLNPRMGASGFGERSELAMPAYQRPAETIEQSGVPHGMLMEQTIYSSTLQRDRIYAVYLPAGYRPDAEPYPSVYFHDGGDYLTMSKAPVTLDNLINSGRIPPLVAVFVPPVDREREYNCDDQFVHFFCDELVPELNQRYNLSSNPGTRAIIGPSLGGLISLYMGSQRPDVFGLVGAQSSAVTSVYGIDKYRASNAFSVEPRLPLRLHLTIGSHEACFGVTRQGQCRDLLSPLRDFRATLERCGYPYRYREEHQGHSIGLWRDSLPDVLSYLFAAN